MSDEVFYVVLVLRKWESLTVMGWPLAGEKDLPGCVGFLPVFTTLEAAQAWRLEQGHEDAAIAPIMQTEDNAPTDADPASIPPASSKEGATINYKSERAIAPPLRGQQVGGKERETEE